MFPASKSRPYHQFTRSEMRTPPGLTSARKERALGRFRPPYHLLSRLRFEAFGIAPVGLPGERGIARLVRRSRRTDQPSLGQHARPDERL